MCDFAFDRFPGHHGKVAQLMQEDTNLQEMCTDYEELAAWLASQSPDGCEHAADCAEARRVLEALEAEIVRKLSSALGGNRWSEGSQQQS